MSHDMFYHECPTQHKINIAIFSALRRQNGSEIYVRHPLNPYHADLGYDIAALFDKQERKLCKNVEHRVELIMSAIRQLVDSGVLEFVWVGGRSRVLTTGVNAPAKRNAPKLSDVVEPARQHTTRTVTRHRAAEHHGSEHQNGKRAPKRARARAAFGR